ncbi:hypothetical protein RP75_25215 [Agrobacterium arsenijevicii]|uniref:Beta-galactosidase trimerisation domain-containing protein n=1 Tax=Agrobacterium arsenijevicii TaxID=1585697 RepID=A0ABR5D0P7_9HYPH|nr:hypothetical protein RP75_25215 [Agrobacterium arsenijevicii]
MFTAEQAARIKAWVEKGGTLIAEACPGYFGDRGHVGQVQPNMGLDTLFGVRQADVEFMPDIGDRIKFRFGNTAVDGSGYLQSYTLSGGNGRGDFSDGRLAVENSFGKGRTLLIGTNPSVAYHQTDGKANGRFFAELLEWSAATPHVTLSNRAVFARVHKGESGCFLWLVNPSRTPQTIEVSIAEGLGKLAAGPAIWPISHVHGDTTSDVVPARDVLILKLA